MKLFFGELIGTFTMVLIGCGSVAVAVLFDTLNLYSIALIWSIGVALGIFVSRKYCPAHLNPAVTIGFLVRRQIKIKAAIVSVLSQVIGAFLASFSLYLIFHKEIALYETVNQIDRGSINSLQTAMMFGEYFPNPGNSGLTALNEGLAFLFEMAGTFVLMLGILIIVNMKISNNLKPIIIGLLVGSIIIVVAPYTQAGLNPARDFGPRLGSYIMGWGEITFTFSKHGWLTVYIIAPIAGALSATTIYSILSKYKRTNR